MTENIEIVKELLTKKDYFKAEQILTAMYKKGDRHYVTLQLLGHSLVFQQIMKKQLNIIYKYPKTFKYGKFI